MSAAFTGSVSIVIARTKFAAFEKNIFYDAGDNE